MHPTTPLALLAVGLLGTTSSTLAATCSANSGPQQATLIELFTSDGCSSCPPADRWLSGFAASQATAPGWPIVALAFHIDYWDYIGWADRFASPAFTARQHERQRALQARFVYTPQTVINGRDSTAWRQAEAPGRLPPLAPAPAGADLTLGSQVGADGQVTVTLTARLLAETGSQPAVAYLALYENGLGSEVRRGENAGRRLRHDFVVRQWLGPLPFGPDGRLDTRQRLALDGVDASRAGLAAVVESRDGRRYHQALALPLCPPS